MATVIRPEISEKNKYWVCKHRHYELKHFCLQYPYWKKKYKDLDSMNLPTANLDRMPSSNEPTDITAVYAIKKAQYAEKIKLVEDMAKEADECLYEYILKAVTEGLSYTYLKNTLGIPCGKDMYYDRYRRFFWLLSESRD